MMAMSPNTTYIYTFFCTQQVLKHLNNLTEVDDYLRFVGRIHDCAGVDPRFLYLTGLAFCQVYDTTKTIYTTHSTAVH